MSTALETPTATDEIKFVLQEPNKPTNAEDKACNLASKYHNELVRVLSDDECLDPIIAVHKSVQDDVRSILESWSDNTSFTFKQL